jgi:hypothetical protein
MRVLVVLGDELAGFEPGGEWSVLTSLVAANGPVTVDVRVLALIIDNKNSALFSNPLGKAVGSRTAAGAATGGRDPGDSARQRLDRALQYLSDLGVRAEGDIVTGSGYDSVHREVAKGGVDRVLVLVRQSRIRALFGRDLRARLHRSLSIPVDGPAEGPQV